MCPAVGGSGEAARKVPPYPRLPLVQGGTLLALSLPTVGRLVALRIPQGDPEGIERVEGCPAVCCAMEAARKLPPYTPRWPYTPWHQSGSLYYH